MKNMLKTTTTQSGLKQIYIKKELANLIPFLSKQNYLIEYNPQNKKIVIIEL